MKSQLIVPSGAGARSPALSPAITEPRGAPVLTPPVQRKTLKLRWAKAPAEYLSENCKLGFNSRSLPRPTDLAFIPFSSCLLVTCK